MSEGPANSLATKPVCTYSPVPIVAPIPSPVSASGPSRRSSRSPEFISLDQMADVFPPEQAGRKQSHPMLPRAS